MDDYNYYRPEDVCRILKITNRTLVRWNNEGKINSIRTEGNHRRFLKKDVDSRRLQSEKTDIRKKICYCRVSTASQKNDLDRQIQFFKLNYPNHTIISDNGSGINFKRKGFKTILESAIKGNIEEIVVTHKDRLCRFGFELIEGIVKEHSNGKIVVLDQKKTSPEKELVDDLISIITVFSSRLYGLRSNSIKNKLRTQIKDSQNQIITLEGREGTDTSDVGPVEMVL